MDPVEHDAHMPVAMLKLDRELHSLPAASSREP
jgi:hypothetical protein